MLRANTSDIPTFEQIFIRGDYDIKIDFEPQLIIDGGAYIGLSAVYFMNRFPNAIIVAVEPSKSNFEMLKRNTYNYKNIKLYNAGLWSEIRTLSIKDEGLGEWGFLVKEIKNKTDDLVDGITIDEILNKSGFSLIDILKLDIEGSEVELFSKNYDNWLGKVKLLLIELHESIRPGCSEVFFGTAKKYDFSFASRGENEVLINKNLLETK